MNNEIQQAVDEVVRLLEPGAREIVGRTGRGLDSVYLTLLRPYIRSALSGRAVIVDKRLAVYAWTLDIWDTADSTAPTLVGQTDEPQETRGVSGVLADAAALLAQFHEGAALSGPATAAHLAGRAGTLRVSIGRGEKGERPGVGSLRVNYTADDSPFLAHMKVWRHAEPQYIAERVKADG